MPYITKVFSLINIVALFCILIGGYLVISEQYTSWGILLGVLGGALAIYKKNRILK